MRKQATRFVVVAALMTAACSDPLNVPNRDNPDFARAFATPGDVEQLISTLYQQIHNGLNGSSDALEAQMEVMSLGSYGTVSNFGMGTRASIPRGAIDNTRNNIADAGNLRDFSHMSRRARDASDAIKALDALLAEGKTLGSKGADNTGLNMRARAFGIFANGVALGNLALSYDSAAIVTHQSASASDGTPALSAYPDVMAAALAELDTAEGIASAASAAAGFPTPTAYFSVALTQTEFLRLIRSYRARFRAGVARTPTERAAVDWTKVIADATTGIQADFIIQLGAGWTSAFFLGSVFQDDSRGWHQMPLMYYGMADTSGTYDAYIALSLGQRDGQVSSAIIRTPDKRWPSGDTRAAQQASSPNSIFTGTGFPYIRNRSGQDTPSADKWAHSFYDFYRWKATDLAGDIGPWAAMTKAEMSMLAAEGYIRKSDWANATTLINASRTNAGMQPIGTITSSTAPVQGGASNCVPRVPVGPNFNTTACGNIMEAMKYEKRMETSMTGYGQWFFDARGWGDLVEGTALHWPVPNQELDARTMPIYSLGGIGGNASAAKGTYGF